MGLNIANAQELLARGIALHQAGRLAEAEQCYRAAGRINPEHPGVYGALGVLALQVGHPEKAEPLLREALQRGVDPHLWCTLGDVYATLGRGDEALKCYEDARKLDPEWLPAYNNAAVTLLLAGRVAEAMAFYEMSIDKAIRRGDPASLKVAGEASSNLSESCIQQGQYHRARAHQLRAIELCPRHAGIGSNLLRAMACGGFDDPREVFDAHQRWWQTYTAAITPLPARRDPDPDRPLRIGFVSPDFRYHSVAHFLFPLFERHDPTRFAFHCYSESAREDDYTVRLAKSVDGWRKIVGKSDRDAAALIDADQIDVLVDLAGHTGGNRMPLFAYRAAPVQVTWLGYPATTGGSVIDYRITDAVADPPGMTDDQFVEKLWRLDRPAWCFRPPADVPAVASLRDRSDGGLTFGSYNAATKYSDATVRMWAKVLHAAPGSRLILKAVALHDEETRGLVRQRFAEQGIAAERLILRGPQPDVAEHLASYGEIDVALDTFPYHGTTTTCDALWMGVPVVTLAGQTHLSRVGVSLLTAAGLEELIARSEEAFVELAVRTAGRTDLRGAGLRERVEKCPWRDEAGFARDFQRALRAMWRAWCGTVRGG
ncbi:MAG TPA: tetratricopeptide repeat protein [Phycisphaerae bacterium]|nr:tetratricopeptide repeat protein [Phycisphaerae bacterium]